MTETDRVLHEHARRVMSAQGEVPASSAAAAEAMQLSCGELYRILETAMAPAGLQALLGRAIQIAARDHPWLATVKAGTAADCALSGLSEASARLGVEEAMDGYAALLATMMGLLVTFVGEDLTLRFVGQAWPKVPFRKLPAGNQTE